MVQEITKQSRLFVIAVALAFIALVPDARAHQLDEYLQSTLVSIEPKQIHLSINLTPGIAIAAQVLTCIDSNHDGVISTNEQTAYGNELKHDLTIALDHQPLSLTLVDFNFPEKSELTNGFGIIQLEFSIPSIALQPGPHQVTIATHHFPNISAYLVNATQPNSPQIQITSQNRNRTQSTATIAFTYRPPVTRSKKITTVTILGVLYCAMIAGVWRLQRKRD